MHSASRSLEFRNNIRALRRNRAIYQESRRNP